MRIYLRRDNEEVHPEISGAFDKVLTINELGQLTKASCEEIDCGVSLDFVPDRMAALSNIVSYIRYNGRLIVKGSNLEEILRAYNLGSITLDVVVSNIYGGKQSISTLHNTVGVLGGFGLKVIIWRNEGLAYMVVAEREKR